jgi:succinoglycan biosynthesis protein ExoI
VRTIALATILLSIVSAASADSIGRASVIDGDTIEIAGERIRFDGIDAPESWQRCADPHGAEYSCGRYAADALDAFLAESRPTQCRAVNRDRYGRTVAECFRADGQSVNAWLVRSGHALDWPRYSRGRYAGEQKAAKRDRLGVWQGTFIEPWRARK